MRRSAFEILIYNFLDTLFAGGLIFSEENGVRPTLPYLTMKVLTGVKIGNSWYNKADDLGDQQILYPVDYSVSIQGYGKGSISYLEDIQENLQKQSSIEFYQENGIGLRDDGDISDITIRLGSTFERRYTLTVIFGTMREVNNGSGYIDKIIGTGAVNNIDVDF